MPATTRYDFFSVSYFRLVRAAPGAAASFNDRPARLRGCVWPSRGAVGRTEASSLQDRLGELEEQPHRLGDPWGRRRPFVFCRCILTHNTDPFTDQVDPLIERRTEEKN